MKYFKLTIIPLLLLATACAFIHVRPSQNSIVERKHISEKNYTLGSTKTVYVGEPIMRCNDYHITISEKPYLRPSNPFTFAGSSFSENSKILIIGETTYRDIEYYVVDIGQSSVRGVTYLIDKNGMYAQKFILSGTFGTEVQPTTYFDISPLTTRFFRDNEENIDNNGEFKNYEILFAGIDSTGINLLYREYAQDDTIRSAFSQNLKYPFETKKIRFKKMEIDVLQVNEQQITYTVINDQQ